jgi:LuxR family transcriptional regulator, quorum-sensing system regulator SdiA
MQFVSNLSLQEKKILALISKGLQSHAIAELLFISDHTVKNHKTNICAKLNFNTITELYQFAFVNATLLQDWGGVETSLSG